MSSTLDIDQNKVSKNSSNNLCETQHSEDKLQHFLKLWDADYKARLEKIDIFNSKITSQWSSSQIKFFIRVLYHLRGHFSDVLWYMGNFAPDYETKQMVIDNIRDEFGMQGQASLSHEQLYMNFAKSFGVDLYSELVDEEFYLPFARAYIEGQLRWLRNTDWDKRVVGFSAIERLDNIDYISLRDIAISIGASGKTLTFFHVHIGADHFESVLNTSLTKIWLVNPKLVEEVFHFIGDYQTNMFNHLSEAVCNFTGKI